MARATSGQPTVLVARTLKGKGLSSIEGKDGWHGKALKSGEEADKAMKELEAKLKRTDAKPAISGPRSSSKPAPPADYGTLPAPAYKMGDLVATREAWGTALAAVGKLDSRIVALDADVKNSTFSDRFEKVAPDVSTRCSSPSRSWSARRWASRLAARFPSRRRSPASSIARRISSAWPGFDAEHEADRLPRRR